MSDEELGPSSDEEFRDVYLSSSYSPSEATSNDNDDSDDTINKESSKDPSEEVNAMDKVKSRKRQRHVQAWKRNIRKRSKTAGKEYISSRGKVVPEKKFSEADCKCLLKCHSLMSLDNRRELFNSFYALESFDLQTSFLWGLIKVVPKQRTYAKTNVNKRQNTRIYHLPNHNGEHIKVCKSFFKMAFGVSDGRLTRALAGREENKYTPVADKRGKKIPWNKTSPKKIQKVKEFISTFPTYVSHYSRAKNQDRRYLAPDLNIKIMYELYKDQCIPDTDLVSQNVFREIFNTSFNLHFHAPISDSCKKCDAFNMKIKTSSSPAESEALKTEQQLHLRKAESARSGMQNDAKLGLSNPNEVTCLAFDLMKTLPTPVLSTGITYYKRQLWTYCLGVHNLSTNAGFMYVWDESVASRGPEEIASCLLHFIKTFVKTKKLIMYSDQCGGQNRNIKMATFCNYVVCSPEFSVEEIDHKFLVSGHSFLPCDQDFGLIEKQKRFYNDVFIPRDWQRPIKSARKKKPFEIIEMKSVNFKSWKTLERNITNRKVTKDKEKVEWLKIQWLHFSKEEPFIIGFKTSNNIEVPYAIVDVGKRGKSLVLPKLELLYPNGRAIDVLKYNDLQILLPYIPPIHHNFYKNLKTVNATESLIEVDEDESD